MYTCVYISEMKFLFLYLFKKSFIIEELLHARVWSWERQGKQENRFGIYCVRIYTVIEKKVLEALGILHL